MKYLSKWLSFFVIMQPTSEENDLKLAEKTENYIFQIPN